MPTLLLRILPLLVAALPLEGWLGVYLDPERDEPVVAEVIPDSPAAKAGLQVGDILVRMGEDAAPSQQSVRSALAAAKPGDRVEVLVRRGGVEHRVFVRLGERPAAVAPKPAAGAAKPARPAAPAAEGTPAPPPAATPVAPRAPAPAAGESHKVVASAKPAPRDVDAEIAALRAELAELRRQLDDLRRTLGRE
jgi:membrane-associated protease RseP (regulator of RpoE activity)